MLKKIIKILGLSFLVISIVLSIVLIVKYAQMTSLQNEILSSNGTPFELIDKAVEKNELMGEINNFSIWFAITVLITAVVNIASFVIDLLHGKENNDSKYNKYR